MDEPDTEQKRPHAVIRALLSIWLVSWLIIILFFISAQFSPQPLFSWKVATIWLGVSVFGWLIVFRLLRKLRQLPPK